MIELWTRLGSNAPRDVAATCGCTGKVRLDRLVRSRRTASSRHRDGNGQDRCRRCCLDRRHRRNPRPLAGGGPEDRSRSVGPSTQCVGGESVFPRFLARTRPALERCRCRSVPAIATGREPGKQTPWRSCSVISVQGESVRPSTFARCGIEPARAAAGYTLLAGGILCEIAASVSTTGWSGSTTTPLPRSKPSSRWQTDSVLRSMNSSVAAGSACPAHRARGPCPRRGSRRSRLPDHCDTSPAPAMPRERHSRVYPVATATLSFSTCEVDADVARGGRMLFLQSGA